MSVLHLWLLMNQFSDYSRSLKREELDVLRNQYVKEEPFVSIQTKFNYAWGLIKSPRRDEQQLGVRLLTGMHSKFADVCPTVRSGSHGI
jgi:hypothetical protein